MALNYIYSDSTGSTIDITDRCRVNQLSVKDHAEEGAVAISTLVVDDPDGDIDFTGHRRFYIFEDTAPAGDQLIYNGFTFNERITRGPNNVGAGRQWTLDLADVNVFLNRRIMNGADANRPAETDTERIVALLAMTELNTVDDDSFVNLTADTVDMDAADYRGQNVGQYIDDCRQASGKNAYVYYNETLGEYGLWYDFAHSTEYDSGKKLSNVLADIDQDEVFEYTDDDRTSWNRDPTRVASGVYMEFDGVGSPLYAQNPITTDLFAAIDWAAPSVNVKTLAKAEARAERYLIDAATEDVKLHVVALMPRTKVNAIKKGQLVQFKGTHFPGFESDFKTCRVLNRTVNEISEDPYLSFELEMDLDPLPPDPLCMACQNTVIENSIRDAITGWRDSGLTDLRGTTWSYVARNNFHSDNALTSPYTPGVDPINALFTWRLCVGAGSVPSTCGTSIGTPGPLDVMVNLSPLPLSQGTSPPFSAVPDQTGIFTVPTVLESNPNLYPFFGFTVTADYGAGPVTVNEGYEVCLTRIA